MLTHLHNFFIPHPCNDHKPHALRPRALKWYAGILIGIKIITTIALFIAYPNAGRLSAEIKQEIANLINQSRTEAGLPTLALNSELNRAAQEKATDMINQDYFAHQAPDGRMPWNFINKKTYNYYTAGENLAIDFSTSRVAHDALMSSETHRENILNANFTDMGLGVVTGEFEGRQTNILVQFFASPVSRQSSPKLVSTVQAAENINIPPNENKGYSQRANNDERKPSKQQPANLISQNTEQTPKVQKPNNTKPQILSNQPDQPPTDLNPNKLTQPPPNQRKIATAVSNSQNQKTTLASVQELQQIGKKQRANKLDIMTSIAAWSQRILFTALIYLILALMAKILIRIRIQHLPVIRQTLMLIIVISVLAASNWHIIERLTNTVQIL